MAKFFIDRPIFAWVIALFIMVMGGVAITQLPIAQYPPVAPPAIVINTAYPGASAQTLIGPIGVHLTRTGPRAFELMVLRGFADSLWHDLDGMAAEYESRA